MQRTLLFITLFAVAVVPAIGLSSWLAWRGVHGALEREFEERLERVAATAAHGIAPEYVAEVPLREEGTGYGLIQVQLVTLRSATGLADASLVDTAGTMLVDAAEPDTREGLPAALDQAARPALAQALGGDTTVSVAYRGVAGPLRAGFAPVRDATGRVVAVVAVQAAAGHLRVAADLGRTLLLIALGALAALGVLAAFLIRGARAAAGLERRLTRAENLAAMGRLTATLAHEIKNPLAIIRGSAQRLGRLEPEAQRMSEFVVEETDRLSRTVARYLQFARGGTEAGGAGDAGDAAGALEATLDLLEGELRARRVALERSGGLPGSAPVALDNESLKQLYLNLLLNALEAMPEGGRLAVSAEARQGRIEVVIADEGPGIPPEVIERLGSPFFTTKATGSGLGLFQARRLARSAGGDLRIRSRMGRGTTVTVVLPARRDEPGRA